ncbi:PucR family transcriptional regulator [Trebonia kvetii]|uniref:PucR family transcriptional regulator n=1 Tax=Trebonia kvetii TaxID=2480626 RepID=A0A6P2BWE2_9ACTN|nr:helix-turn-helix domain-containing protein [Trebonia kvetii]TVZ03374.1 PucR family transcriptional regulator [Trebonia kvetii]
MEKYAEVLLTGQPPGPDGQAPGSAAAAGWLPPAFGTLAEDIAAAVMSEVEEYAQPADEEAARAVRRVARDAVAGFAARLTGPAASPVAQPPGAASAAGMFRDLGRLLAMEGRSLGALHAALRVGARVTWHRLLEQARQGSGNPETFTRVGETVFWYLDELTASCSAGYAEARAELAGDTNELRRRLLDMLTSSPAPPAPAIAGLARAAGWPLPRRVAAVALTPLAGRACGPLPPGVLADLTRRDPCLLIADPDGPGRRQQLATLLGGWLTTAEPDGGRAPSHAQLAAVGPLVSLTGAGGSLRWAGRALALAGRGLIRVESSAGGAAGIAWCEDHLPTLVLLADEDLAAALSRQALTPLRGLRPDQADRLARTLLAWLESADDANAAARLLHVHPQTIRYRLRQVSELFGDALGEPDTRFRLLLALRARLLLGA